MRPLGCICWAVGSWLWPCDFYATLYNTIERLFVGWTLQLAMAVAFWILPRFRTSCGNEGLAWLALVSLNTGVWLVNIGDLIGVDSMLLAGRTAEVAAILAFTLHAWPRIKPFALGG